MPTEIMTCAYSPMISCPEKMDTYKGYANTGFTLYKCEDGRHFFYAECDPGLFYPYLWWRCSPGTINIEEDRTLHFNTQSGSHYVFQISDYSWDELREYVENAALA